MNVNALIHQVRYSAPVNAVRRILKRISFPGFEKMSLYDALKFVKEAFTRSDIATKSAAISFKLFIALFPAVILLLTLIPYVPIENFQQDLLNSIAAIMPENVETIIFQTIEDLILKKHTGFLSVGFVLTIYYASSIINSILTTFSKSYQIEITRNPLKQRAISLVLMIIITLMMLIGFALILFSESAISYFLSTYVWESEWITFGLRLAKWVAVFLLFVMSISTLYNVALIRRKAWVMLSAGATWATVLIIIASLGMSFYIDNFDSYNKLYGSIGSLIVFLIWINISSTILIMGFELYAKSNTIAHEEE
ncbi:MAG: YihY/virulence factor BrkB family protein [Flavobacteriales bacterium]